MNLRDSHTSDSWVDILHSEHKIEIPQVDLIIEFVGSHRKVRVRLMLYDFDCSHRAKQNHQRNTQNRCHSSNLSLELTLFPESEFDCLSKDVEVFQFITAFV